MSTIGWRTEHEAKAAAADIVQKTQQLGRPAIWVPFSLLSGVMAKAAGKTFMHRIARLPSKLREEPAFLLVHITSDEPGDRTRFTLRYHDGCEVAVDVADLWFGSIAFGPDSFTQKLHVVGPGERTLDGKQRPRK